MTFVSNLPLAFHEIVAAHGDRVALHYPSTDSKITYRQLADDTARIAGILYSKGLKKGDVVTLFHDKSPEAFATMLACLRLGVTYANLDPDSPWERIRKILTNCRPKLLINSFAILPHETSLLNDPICEVLQLNSLTGYPNDTTTLPCEPSISGSAPAYIMFTSGSTGQPKGAVMSHANLLWFTAWSRNRFELTPGDVLTNANPIYFDNSVFDFYSAIFTGATLVPFSPAEAKDSRLLVRLVNQARCTVWFSVPSLLVYLLTTRALGASDFPSMRKIIFGGEGFPKPKLKQLYDLFGSRAELENVYGPTECTCICSAHTVNISDFEDMQGLTTLGPLAQNFEGEVIPLDPSQPDFGELFLRGPQVGMGYFNDPERTSKSFVQNPYNSRHIEIGYRTGDLVQKDAQGRFHFKGRADFQIKHMGYRIELEEIESALSTLPGVHECAVIYQKISDGLGQILGYVSMSAAESPEELLRRVAMIVPPYMVPKRINVLASLPKNANGKIDRQALLGLNSQINTR